MPPVTDPSFKIVFCEGRPGSLDELFLSHILPLGQVLIRPVGGKYGLRAFIEGYLGSYTGSQPPYLAFRDRDLDVEPSEHPELIPCLGEKPIWLGHRAAIENYVIDADLLRRYWIERESTPGWRHGPALPVEQIQDHIQTSARELVDYQAVRWALSRLKPGPRWPEIQTTWAKNGSGSLPPSLDYHDCIGRASQLVDCFHGQVQGINSDRLCELARAYQGRFHDRGFWEKQGYLAWFHGKDHLTLLCRHLASGFPQKNYAEWAIEHVDIQKHPDLQQLVNLVKERSLSKESDL